MFFVLKNLQVENFNMSQVPGVITPVPLMAASLFVHALGKRAGFDPEGFALVVHSVSPRLIGMATTEGYLRHSLLASRASCAAETRTTKPRAIRATPSGQPNPAQAKVVEWENPSFQPEATSDGLFSVIIRVSEETEISAERLRRTLMRMRFAGGTIHFEDRDQASWLEDLSELSLENLSALFSYKLRAGDLILSAENTVQALQGDHPTRSVADCILQANKLTQDFRDSAPPAYGVVLDEEDLTFDENRHAAFHLRARRLLPVNVGYSLLEAPTQKPAVRLDPATGQPAEHACAEAMIGLVSAVSVRSFAFALQDRPIGLHPFWQHTWVTSSIFKLEALPFGLGAF